MLNIIKICRCHCEYDKYHLFGAEFPTFLHLKVFAFFVFGLCFISLFGFKTMRTDAYEDLVTSGVIDATKAFRCALQNAASVAATLLTCNCLIVQEDEPINYPTIR